MARGHVYLRPLGDGRVLRWCAVIDLVLDGQYQAARSLVAQHPNPAELANRTVRAAVLLLRNLDVDRGGHGRGAELASRARAACLDFAPDLGKAAQAAKRPCLKASGRGVRCARRAAKRAVNCSGRCSPGAHAKDAGKAFDDGVDPRHYLPGMGLLSDEGFCPCRGLVLSAEFVDCLDGDSQGLAESLKGRGDRLDELGGLHRIRRGPRGSHALRRRDEHREVVAIQPRDISTKWVVR